jgi:predicted extracellular nuclease
MRLSRASGAIGAVALVATIAVPFGIGSASAVGGSAPSPLALLAPGCVESFDGLVTALPPGASLDEVGTSARVDGLYTAEDGTGNAGDVYSLGTSGSNDRAFGTLLSGTITPTIGVVVRNDTGTTLTSLGVAYSAEQWRQGGTARFDRLDFSYSTTTTALTGGSYTALAALNGGAANGASVTGALNGNSAANKTAVAGMISGLSVAPGGSILLRWSDVNAAGADDMLGVDDLALTPNGAPAPTTACSAGGGNPQPTTTLIHDIQGSAATSPLSGSKTVEGIVVGVDDQIGSSFGTGNAINTFPTDRGFYLQEEVADYDANPLTSEGIFIGLSSASTALPSVGDKVRLTGTIRDGQSAPAFGQTRLETSSFTVVSPGNALPAPVVIDQTAASTQTIGNETNPTRSYYETLEGMRVTLTSGVAQSGGTNKFGELFLVPGTAGGTLLRTDPVQPGLIATQSDAGAGNPANPYIPAFRSTTWVEADQGDTVTNLTGPLMYSFSNYKIVPQANAAPTVADTGKVFPYAELPAATPGQKRIVSFNVENFFPVGGALDGGIITPAQFAEKRDQIADAIGRLLRAPDVVIVAEVGDNNHLGQSGGTSSLATLQLLAARLGELGYGNYAAYMLEGNDSRGIDSGFLVKDTVPVLAGPDQRGGLTAAGSCSDVAGRLFDRPPLFLQVDLGPTIGTPWLVANHFASKSAPDSCRVAQATWVRDQVVALKAGGDEVIVGGDLNAFEDEGALSTLQTPQSTLDNLWDAVPHDQAYSYHFNGLLQTLDHVLVTDGIAAKVEGFTYAHFDNGYSQRLAQPDGHHVSDHDPPVLTLGGGGPGPVVPEAPYAWMLAIAGLVTLAGGTHLIQRRPRATST